MRNKEFSELDYLNSCTSYSEFIMKYNMKFGNKMLKVDEIKYVLRILIMYKYCHNNNGSYSWVFNELLKDRICSRITTKKFQNYLLAPRSSRIIRTWKNCIWKVIDEIRV